MRDRPRETGAFDAFLERLRARLDSTDAPMRPGGGTIHAAVALLLRPAAEAAGGSVDGSAEILFIRRAQREGDAALPGTIHETAAAIDRGFTPRSRRYFTMVTRLPPVAFIGSANSRSFPSSEPASKYERSRLSTYSMVASSFESSREILNSANGVTYPFSEYSWISLDMIIDGSRAPRSMTHMTLFSM